MTDHTRTYLALGDSMSIDDYTGVAGGGAVQQFFRSLGAGWRLDDRTLDGCRMRDTPTGGAGELVTLTIGGNDLLWERERYLREGLECFGREHLALLTAIRRANPDAAFIVGDIYAPGAELSQPEQMGLAAANALIAENCRQVDARLAPIHQTFLGRESEYLCLQIEPTLAGATAIAQLFQEAFEKQ